MPRRRNSLPKLCRDKPSGRALVYIDGQRIYLGKWGTKQARAEYDRIIALWLASGRRLPKPAESAADPELTLNELMLAYWRHVVAYYRKPDGTPTSEQDNIRQALRWVKCLYRHTSATEFGPIALEVVRKAMIDFGWSRGWINRSVDRIKRMFKWAVGKELVPASVYESLKALPGLRKGRSDARETEEVKPVPEAFVDAIRPDVGPQVWSMVELQRLTGMRPGEVTVMRGCDLDTSGAVWTYELGSHKTVHHGHRRLIGLGPRAQAVLRPWLKPDLQAYLFSPRQAEEARHAQRRRDRKSPMTPSQTGRTRKRNRKRPWGQRYRVDSYRRAIQKACDKADVPSWFPRQLRHNAGTRVRKEYGLEVARAVLGHKTAAVTEIYAEMDGKLVLDVMEKLG